MSNNTRNNLDANNGIFRIIDLVHRSMNWDSPLGQADGLVQRISGVLNTDVWETDSAYQIQVALPAYATKADTALTVKDHVLTVKVKASAQDEDKSVKYLCQEINRRAVERRFNLPGDIDETAVKAKFVGNLLNIELPKLATAPTAVKEIAIA